MDCVDDDGVGDEDGTWRVREKRRRRYDNDDDELYRIIRKGGAREGGRALGLISINANRKPSFFISFFGLPALSISKKNLRVIEMKAAAALFIFAYILLDSLIASSSADTFDVRRHLSTATGYFLFPSPSHSDRYDAVKGLSVYDFEASTVPEGCSAIHLNLLARHGTRSPTKKRIKQLNDFAIRLEALLKDAKEKAQEGTLSLQMIPGWLWEWKSPWKGKKKGGELVSKGEEELYRLGIRTRERFPNLFGEEYHPDIFSIRATQVPRASASAVAFGMGLFCGKGSLGPGRHRSFAVICESRASDICLRFHDTCESYKEASLLDIDHQACGLFSPSELALLEWADDLEAFILKGYGKEINYHMGVPLLQDVVQSMEEAIVANEVSLLDSDAVN
ncbi:hypothetical protein ACLOJK_003400 [Asimina triloba]